MLGMTSGGRFSSGQAWTRKGRLDELNRQRSEADERRRALLAAMAKPTGSAKASAAAAAPERLSGLTKPLNEALRYSRTTASDETLIVADGLPLLETMRGAIHDRVDRVVLAWPQRPDNGFVAVALYLLEGRARGWHGHATLALWPWRSASPWTSRSVLVEPAGIYQCARAAADDLLAGAAWTKAAVNHDALNMVQLRLRDLVSPPATKSHSSEYTVRRPTLFELTSFFAPSAPGSRRLYGDEAPEPLKRVLAHTLLKKNGTSAAGILAGVSHPAKAPLAVLGLPLAKESIIKQYFGFERFSALGLDLVVADLTRTAITEMGENWPIALERLALALRSVGERRPGILVLAEDTFVFGKAEKVLRNVAQQTKSRGKPYIAEGLLLRYPGFLGIPRPKLVSPAPIKFNADIKDGSLITLRKDVLKAAGEMVEAGAPEAAAALRSGLSFVRLIANLPVGYAEARRIIHVLHGTDDDSDQSIRQRFFRDAALSPLTRAIVEVAGFREVLSRIYERMTNTVDAWDIESPISLKIRNMIEAGETIDQKTLFVLPDRNLVDIFLASDIALRCRWSVTNGREMLETARLAAASRMVVVRPTSNLLRTLITGDSIPPRVDILGDASGAALLAAELAPIAKLAAFAAYAGRASALMEAIGKSTSNLQEDEQELELPLPVSSQDIDFTQSGEVYSGPVICLATERGHRMLYRPSSDVLRHTPDELRAFERVDAAMISRGDHVLVLAAPLMEALRQALARAPKTVETLRAYHRAVAERCATIAGSTRMDKARHIHALIKARDSTFEDSEVFNVSHWINVDETTIDTPGSRPQAPRSKKRFDLFMDGLGIIKVLSDNYWDWGIRATRSYRMREGLLFNQRATQFILEPESLMAKRTDRDMRGLWHAVMDNVDVVTSKEQINAR